MEKKEKERLAKVEQSKDGLAKKEKKLADDENSADHQLDVVETSLRDATRRLKEAIESNDILGVNVASDMIDSARKRLETAKMHRGEQRKERKKIGKKRTDLMDYLMKKAKKD